MVGDFGYTELVSRLHALEERTGRDISIVAMRPGELHEQLGEGGGFVEDIMGSPMKVLVGDLGTP